MEYREFDFYFSGIIIIISNRFYLIFLRINMRYFPEFFSSRTDIAKNLFVISSV